MLPPLPLCRSCSSCNHSVAFKRMEIWRLPPILLINIKRFIFEGQWREKRQNYIDYPVRYMLMDHVTWDFMFEPKCIIIVASIFANVLIPYLFVFFSWVLTYLNAFTCLIMHREPLNMLKFVVGEQPKPYHLYAVSNHFGSLAGGHCKYPCYIAYCCYSPIMILLTAD